jgi:hypothetical protein
MRLTYKDGPKESTFEECSIFPNFKSFGDRLEKNIHKFFFINVFFPYHNSKNFKKLLFLLPKWKNPRKKKRSILQEDGGMAKGIKVY